MHWLVVCSVLLAVLWGALAYAATAALLLTRVVQVRSFAGLAALLVAVATGAMLLSSHSAGVAQADVHSYPVAGCAGRLSPAGGIAQGALDVVRVAGKTVSAADPLFIDRGASLELRGWASDASAHHPVAAACVLVDGNTVPGQRASYGTARPDVAKAFGTAAVEKSGFEIEIPAGELAPGPHELIVVGVDAAGRDEAIAKARRVVVR